MTRLDYCALRSQIDEAWFSLMLDHADALYAYTTYDLLKMIRVIEQELELRAEGQHDDHCG